MKQKTKAVKKDLKSLYSIAKLVDPLLAPDVKAAIGALPDLTKATALARRVMSGGSELKHYPALRELV